MIKTNVSDRSVQSLRGSSAWWTPATTRGVLSVLGAFAVFAVAAIPGTLTAQQPVVRPGAAGAPGAAAPPPVPTVGPAISRIETASALSKEPMLAITNVRELPNGDILINDTSARRLILLDSTLALKRVVLDSVAETYDTYGLRGGGLLPYKADSTLFIDPASFAMLVLDPTGTPSRVRALWRTQDATYTTGTTPGGIYGPPGLDARGRIVYRVPAVPAPPAVAPPAGVPYFPPTPDSAFIVAVDVDTRKIDTLGVVRLPRAETRVRQTGTGSFSIETVNNPVPLNDDWTVLSDGTVAFIRGVDYRVEYLTADGKVTSSPKLPYDWQRLLDADKQRIVDSVRTALRRTAANTYTSAMIRWVNMYAQLYPKGFTVPEGYVPALGFGRDWMLPTGVTFPTANYIYACRPGEEPVVTGAAGAAGAAAAAAAAAGLPTAIPGGIPGGGPVIFGGPPGAGGGGPVVFGGPPGAAGGGPVIVGPGGAAPGTTPPPGAAGAPLPAGAPSCLAAAVAAGGAVPAAPLFREPAVVEATQLPDYKAPIPVASARADKEGNIWIRTNPIRPIPGGQVYDIISRAGELVNRIQLPTGYTLVGFGKDKVVYLSMRDATGIHLARVRLR